MDRNILLLFAGLLAAPVGLGANDALSALGRDAQAETGGLADAMASVGKDSDHPISVFDIHSHFSAGLPASLTASEAISRMRKAGFIGLLVSSTPDTRSQELFRSDPSFVVPEFMFYKNAPETTPGDRRDWPHEDWVPGYILENLHNGIPYRGIGEFHIYDDTDLTSVEKSVIRIAKEHGLFLHAHSHIGAIQKIFVENPQAVVIWAHAGFTCGARCPQGVDPAPIPSASTVAAMIDSHPGLYVDLSFRDHLSLPQTNLTIADGPRKGRLPEDWVSVINSHPHRFLMGTDTFQAPFAGNRWDTLAPIMGDIQSWLNKEDFPDDHVRHLIARGNAERLLGFKAAAK